MTRLVIAAIALVALLAFVATLRELDVGRRALADSDAAAARGDYAEAMAGARDAAEAAAPGSPYVREGYARLESIARGAESRADEKTAVSAWGAMRAAATASPGPLVATDSWIALANDGLVRAGAPAAGSVPSGEVHASEATLRASLAREDASPASVLTFLGLGALLFFGGCARLAFAVTGAASLHRERIALAATAAGALLYAFLCIRS